MGHWVSSCPIVHKEQVEIHMPKTIVEKLNPHPLIYYLLFGYIVLLIKKLVFPFVTTLITSFRIFNLLKQQKNDGLLLLINLRFAELFVYYKTTQPTYP